MDGEINSKAYYPYFMAKQFRRTEYHGNGYQRNKRKENEHQGNGYRQRIATIGGTFDTLHKGHGEYILLAFDLADHVVIYLNSDENINGKKNYTVRTYEERLKNLQEFIHYLGYENRCEIRCLDKFEDVKTDYLKEFISDDKIYIAIVSQEYLDFFLDVNNIRENLCMKSLLIMIKPRLRNGKADISSYAIRNRLIENADSYCINLESPIICGSEYNSLSHNSSN